VSRGSPTTKGQSFISGGRALWRKSGSCWKSYTSAKKKKFKKILYLSRGNTILLSAWEEPHSYSEGFVEWKRGEDFKVAKAWQREVRLPRKMEELLTTVLEKRRTAHLGRASGIQGNETVNRFGKPTPAKQRAAKKRAHC